MRRGREGDSTKEQKRILQRRTLYFYSVNMFRRKGTSDRQIEIVQTMCACVLVGAEIGASQTTKKRALVVHSGQGSSGARNFHCEDHPT